MRRLLPVAAALAACSVPSRDFADMSAVPDAAPDAVPEVVADAAPDAVPGPVALVSVTPRANAVGVDRATSIVLTFDTAITAASAAAAIQITDRVGQAVAGQLDVREATATFRPARPLTLLATYQISVSRELRGTGGGALAEAVTASFTTRDGAWSASRVLVDRNSFGCADTAFDAAGAPLTAWDESGASGRWNVWGAIGADGERQRLSIVDTSASCPRLAASRGGTALAVWTQSANAQHLTANHYTAGEGWAEPETVQPVRGPLHALAVDDQGNAHVVYNNPPAGSNEGNYTWVRRWNGATRAWDEPSVLVETLGEIAVAARLAASADGRVLMLWRTSAGVLWRGHLRGSSSLVSSGIVANIGDQEELAVDRAGNALILFRANSRVQGRFYRAASDTWEPATPLGEPHEAPVDPAVALDDDGRAVALWANVSDESRRGLWSQSFDPVHGWGAPVMIDRLPPNWSTPPTSAQPRLAFDGEGRALAVWVQSDGTRERVWWNRRNRDGAWQGAAVLDDSMDGTPSAPHLAVDRSGSAHVVWKTTSGFVTSLRASRFE